LECASADSFEGFVEDDAFQGGEIVERHIFNDCELIGEGNALEGVAVLEYPFSDSLEVFVEDDAFEAGAMGER